MQLSLAVQLATVVGILVALCSGSQQPEQWALSAVDSLARSAQLSTAASEVLQRYRFRLANHRVHEQTPRELLDRLAADLRSAGCSAPELDSLLETILRKTPDTWQADVGSSSSACSGNAPEVTLNELNSDCTTLDSFINVFGCRKAAADYCAMVSVPGKRYTGTFASIDDGIASVVCSEGSISEEFPNSERKRFLDLYCRDFVIGVYDECTQDGAHQYCRAKHGQGYTGRFVEDYHKGTFHFVCMKQARMEWVPETIVLEMDSGCRSIMYESRHSCIRAISNVCRRFFGLPGGFQTGKRKISNRLEALISCFEANAYTNKAFINKDVRFFEAKGKVTDVCSLDFHVNSGRILSSSPDELKVETYDNRKSSVELRDSFTISRSVTTVSSFSHSHSLTISMEATVKSGIPVIAETQIKVSSSYTAQISLTKSNSRTTQYSQTSQVVVPPGHAIRKKATITRSTMDVPWSATALNGLGKVVQLTGTWTGVDVSDVFVSQEDL